MNGTRLLAHFSAGSFLGGCVLLRELPPEKFSFYPKCPVFSFLHLYCPGCGATRALAALTHGHFAEALRNNAFFVILLPMLLAYFGFAYWRAMRNLEFSWPTVPPRILQLLCATAVLFAILRNALHLPI